MILTQGEKIDELRHLGRHDEADLVQFGEEGHRCRVCDRLAGGNREHRCWSWWWRLWNRRYLKGERFRAFEDEQKTEICHGMPMTGVFAASNPYETGDGTWGVAVETSELQSEYVSPFGRKTDCP